MLREIKFGLVREIITNKSELDALRVEWTQLWNRTPDATPFQSPEWLDTWWQFFGRYELLVVLWRAEKRLVGIAPFCIQRDGGTRKLLLIGTGISDYLDVLFDNDCRGELTIALAEFLSETDCWNLCDFHQLRENSPLLELEIPGVNSDAIYFQEVCPLLILPKTHDELSNVIPAKRLDNIEYYRRRAEKNGRVEIEPVTSENIDELLNGLICFHRARKPEARSTFSDETVCKFHHRVAREFFHSGHLRLFGLRVEQQLVAALYGFAHGNRVCYYGGAFNADFASISPGTLLLAHAIEEAIREHTYEFDFMRGSENYKYLWGAKDQRNYRRYISR